MASTEGPHAGFGCSNGSSSAVDLSGTGLGVSTPRSPALRALDTDVPTYTRRRLSWSNAEDRPDLPSPNPAATPEPGPINLEVSKEDPSFSEERHFQSDSSLFSNPHPDASTTSLLSMLNPDAHAVPDDDETRLTREVQPGVDIHWSGDLSADSEYSAGFMSQPKRHPAAPSSLKLTLLNAFCRASIRVANVRGHTPYVRLQDDNQDPQSDPTSDAIEGTIQRDAGESIVRPTLPSIYLRGRALGILGPTNPLRSRLCKLLIHPYTEPTILALILLNAIALVVQASRTLLLPSTQAPITIKGYFHGWEDFVIFVLFVLFTIEALGRICISGLLLDPEVPTSSLFSPSFYKLGRVMSTNSASNDNVNAPLIRSGSLARGFTLRRVCNHVAQPFSLSLSSHATTPPSAPMPTGPPPSSSAFHGRSHSEDPETTPTFLSRVMRSDILDSNPDILVSLPFRLDIQMARSKIERNIPYLRQGWGRIDFVAVIGFWVSFALATAGLERGIHHHGIFRAFSVLRTARLLGITNGTTTIMRSLKIARPLLANVIYFIIFAVVLFSVIGVQSFKRSLRRSCNLLPVLGANSTQLTQICGGHINATTLAPSPYLHLDGTPGTIAKGFICPLGQVCQEGENPFGGVESFDTVYYAALQIVILASASTWSRAMYQIMASEYYVSFIFFILAVLVLNFWLFNLLVAVITNSFSAIRSGTKKSAFGAAPLRRVDEEPEEGWSAVTRRHIDQQRLKVWWSYSRWFWVLLALTSLAVQATATADMNTAHREIIDMTERIITFAFDVEIVIRIATELPAWRKFFLYGNNWLDMIIAIGASVIQIPAIHNSSVYRWLTVFQLARFYRVLLVVPRMKPLMLTVFGNMYGLVNMTLFLMLITFLAALVGIQLIQGDMAGTVTLNFSQLFNSFLAVYQILSGESWTSVLYAATDAELNLGQAAIVCIFLCCWLLFSNFIVMQMFIAVINENFDVAEEVKRKIQTSNYSKQHSQTTTDRWTIILNPYLWLKARPTTVDTENPLSNSVLGETETLVQHNSPPTNPRRRAPSNASSKSRRLRRRSFSLLHELFTGSEKIDDIPLLDLYRVRSESRGPEDPAEHKTDRYFDILSRLNKEPSVSKDSGDIYRTQTIDLIRKYPTYDKTFWIFPQTNRLRRLCQKVVCPSGGERIFGTPPSDIAHTFFQLTIFLAVLGSVVTEAIATPLYRRGYYMQYGPVRGAWFHVTEATFGLILFAEFLIKIVADGFLFTPNAYIRNIWNILDFVVMVGILANVTFTLVFVAGLSRFIRALKALQALRLMTLIDKMRSTFEDLALAGFIRILDASVLAILYLIPFSVWGTTIFAGLMNECNDTGVKGIGDCTNEYVNAIYGGNFGFPIPRVWDNPAPSTQFSFDSFPASMLILFEIVSQVGWVDVMSVAMSITGKGQQPQINASQANAIFFVIYNLLGAVVILTLFVSIIIGNFSSRTGEAYVTEAQREWIDLQKLIKRLRPSKRPKVRPSSPIRAWCYDRAIHKHGWWTRMMTLLFVVQIIVLMTQAFSAETANDWHNVLSVIISLTYVVDTIIRLYGLGWHSFRANGWNLFDVVVASGSFTTTLFARFYPNNMFTQLLQKLFLVSMAFKLVQSVTSLNQLFKTGTASLSAILNLLALWLTFFLFFTIMFMEVFGLTKWYSGENTYQNYQTMGSAFLMLVSMSTGEGWNLFMHDYALAYPRCTQVFYGVYQTDCGSTAWAFSLFIAWNLLSMFIFVNMFTGVIVHSFSYVFQSTGGVLKSVTRHETRAFKKAWAQFSDPSTGLLESPNLVPFLAKLDGVFEVRIYPSEYSTASIMTTCRDKSKTDGKVGGIQVRKLNRLLDKIDFGVIRQRRAVYLRIYYEASVLYRRGKGISFTEMLLLLAHHKLIDDREALGLKELEEREQTLALVEDFVRLDKVHSQLLMVFLRRRFLRGRDRALMVNQGLGVNSVSGSSTPKASALRDIASTQNDHGREWGMEHDLRSLTSSPELLAREQTGSLDNLLDDATIYFPTTVRTKETRILQAEEGDV